MTPEELVKANIKTIRSANRGAYGVAIIDPIILVFDMSDEHVVELATHCFRGETPKDKVAVWAKPLTLTRNWLIRTYATEDSEKLAGDLQPPENADQIRCLVFTAEGCQEVTTC